MKRLSKFYLFLVVALLAGSFFVHQNATADVASGTSDTSLNWSGYGISGAGMTAVNASWILPHITTSNTLTSDSTWVGIGGITNSDLIQIGTDAFSSGSQINYQVFYEMLPQPPVIVPLTVAAGDSVTASIFETSSSQWALSVMNNTSGQSFQIVVPYTSTNSSAEWIEEMQSNGNNAFIPLDDFSPIQFSGCSVIQGGVTQNLSQSNAQTISMIDGSNQPLTTVSVLSVDGAGFTVARTSSTPVSSTTWQQSTSQREYRNGEGIRDYKHSPGNWNHSHGTYNKCMRHLYVSSSNFQNSDPYTN